MRILEIHWKVYSQNINAPKYQYRKSGGIAKMMGNNVAMYGGFIFINLSILIFKSTTNHKNEHK